MKLDINMNSVGYRFDRFLSVYNDSVIYSLVADDKAAVDQLKILNERIIEIGYRDKAVKYLTSKILKEAYEQHIFSFFAADLIICQYVNKPSFKRTQINVGRDSIYNSAIQYIYPYMVYTSYELDKKIKDLQIINEPYLPKGYVTKFTDLYHGVQQLVDHKIFKKLTVHDFKYKDDLFDHHEKYLYLIDIVIRNKIKYDNKQIKLQQLYVPK